MSVRLRPRDIVQGRTRTGVLCSICAMRFIDLFAGLGGFHLALRALGHQCVFASEIDETLRTLYSENFGMAAAGDIRNVDAADIPPHDILCAGFPCQPFSKARDYSEPSDPELSELYLQILRIVQSHAPRLLILENVPNFARHENGQTWERVANLLRKEGYFVDLAYLSPHEFGIPQIRERVYIVGSRDPLADFQWPRKVQAQVSIDSVLDTQPVAAHPIPGHVKQCLAVWQEFLDRVPKDVKIPHPLWSMEFGATYPYQDGTPWSTSTETLSTCLGSYATPLSAEVTRESMFNLLPSHARTQQERFPNWKIGFIRRNREFYAHHKDWLDEWIPRICTFPSSFQKLEWNCQEKDPRTEARNIWKYVIQMRASGVRVKRKTTAPSLVAMTATQVPIIAWEQRYMTTTECKRLQSMEELSLPVSESKAYEALGNAVNVEVVTLVAKALIGHGYQGECWSRDGVEVATRGAIR